MHCHEMTHSFLQQSAFLYGTTVQGKSQTMIMKSALNLKIQSALLWNILNSKEAYFSMIGCLESCGIFYYQNIKLWQMMSPIKMKRLCLGWVLSIFSASLWQCCGGFENNRVNISISTADRQTKDSVNRATASHS